MISADVYARLKNFDEQYIPFPPFVAAMTAIEANLQMFRETGVATHMLVTGEAGTGKSSLCRWLAHQHPRRVLPERDVVELLITAIPPAASISSIASTMLQSLGDPHANAGTVSQKTQRVITLSRGCGVEMLLFDETQHLQDRGATKTHYMVGDWLKHLIDELAVPSVLLGLPRLENVLQVNDQLRRRFSSRRRLAVGQSDTDSIETECLQLYLSLTSLIDIPVLSHPYSAQEMGVRLYYASDGRVAYIKKLLFAALRWALEQDLDVIDAPMLEKSFTDEIWWNGVGKLNPFNPGFECRRLDRGGEPFQVASSPRKRSST